jgi:type VI protein secretion system component VasK
VIVQVGDIAVTSTVVHTPAGDIPLAGSTWQVSDYWHSEQRIPRWAIIAAIAGFCVLTVFSLLFLLAKETVPRGTVQVTVTNGTRQYVARIPVTDQAQVSYVHQQVNYVRSLAAL